MTQLQGNLLSYRDSKSEVKTLSISQQSRTLFANDKFFDRLLYNIESDFIDIPTPLPSSSTNSEPQIHQNQPKSIKNQKQKKEKIQKNLKKMKRLMKTKKMNILNTWMMTKNQVKISSMYVKRELFSTNCLIFSRIYMKHYII